MFDKAMVEAYQKTTAPVELKERVMKTCQTGNTKGNSIRLYKSLSMAAACLALILSAAAFTGRSDDKVSIFMNGSQIAGEPMIIDSIQTAESNGIAMASLQRTVQPKMCIPLEVEVSPGSVITVSDGEMQVFAPATGELLFTGSEYTAKEAFSVEWYLANEQEAFSEGAPYMCITSEEKEHIVQLEYDETDDVWMIYQR